MVRLKSTRFWTLGAVALVMAGCRGDEGRPLAAAMGSTPYERYVQSLEVAGISKTAVGRDWLEASSAALTGAHVIAPPFRETGFWDYRESDAVGFRFAAKRGQLILVDVDIEADASMQLFIDLFQVLDDTAQPVRRVASADGLETRVAFEAFLDGEYFVRLQPEMLRGGRYTVTIRQAASLEFPVMGLDTRAIRSGFGAPRDGGRRDHHGVDIFAPRGTPVIAADDGWASARNNRLGGRVVWLRADGGGSLYYAHLDAQVIGRRRERVLRGDTLGFVGNSGNARTTPPHLHFGVYSRSGRRGPADPHWYLFAPPGQPRPILADVEQVGTWRRAAQANVRLATSPAPRAATIRLMERYAPMRVVGAVGNWYRVELPNGLLGFIDATLTETLEGPIRQERLAAARPLRARPQLMAAVVDTAAAGTRVPVLGAFDSFLFVQSPSGRTGWMAMD